MTALRIHHLHHRLRLPPGCADQRARVERLMAAMLGHALEPALQRCGLDRGGELCIRCLTLPVLRLDLARGDEALIEAWADVWARAIARAAREHGAQVLRYASRAQAVVELAVQAMSGTLERHWAWQQLGLWPAGEGLTAGDLPGLVTRALLAEPRAVPAALSRLAARPAAWAPWMQGAGVAGLPALAWAVLREAGVAQAVWRQAEADAARPGPGPAGAPAGVLAACARLHGGSRIARRTAAGVAPAAPASRAALAVLAVAESEPAWLQAPPAPLGALLALLAAPGGLLAPAAGLEDAGAHSAGPPAGPARPGGAGRPQPPAVPDREPGPAHRPGETPAVAADLAVLGTALVAEEDAPADRCRGRTRYGGLLFLLHLAGALGWPLRLLADPALAGRSLRWSLHQLARRLLPLEADDPAALAFCGLAPGQAPPGAGEPLPDAAQSAALAHWHACVLQALRRRLEPACPELPDDDATLLEQVCAREGEVVADPGWLALRLPLEGVRTEVRRAGLDLDPGWLPWLGVTLRFVYD